jgi:hypothetical protein
VICVVPPFAEFIDRGTEEHEADSNVGHGTVVRPGGQPFVIPKDTTLASETWEEGRVDDFTRPGTVPNDDFITLVRVDLSQRLGVAE